MLLAQPGELGGGIVPDGCLPVGFRRVVDKLVDFGGYGRRVSDGDAAVSVHAAHRPRLSVGDAELGVVLAGRYLRACGDGVTVHPMRDSGGVDRTGVDQTLVHGMVDLLRGRVRRRDRDGGAAGLLLDSWGKRWGTEYVLARIAMHEGADIASRIDFMRFSVR